MFTKPSSTTTPVAPTLPAPSIEASPLSATELYQLTLYKWRYSLEAFGFDQDEVRELMFVKWLFTSRRVLP